MQETQNKIKAAQDEVNKSLKDILALLQKKEIKEVNKEGDGS